MVINCSAEGAMGSMVGWGMVAVLAAVAMVTVAMTEAGQLAVGHAAMAAWMAVVARAATEGAG